jgi:hypothetical protein
VRDSKLMTVARSFFPATPALASRYERPLTLKDIRLFAMPFRIEVLRAFGLPASRILGHFRMKDHGVPRAEDWLLRRCGFLKKFATFVVFRVVKDCSCRPSRASLPT